MDNCAPQLDGSVPPEHSHQHRRHRSHRHHRSRKNSKLKRLKQVGGRLAILLFLLLLVLAVVYVLMSSRQEEPATSGALSPGFAQVTASFQL